MRTSFTNTKFWPWFLLLVKNLPNAGNQPMRNRIHFLLLSDLTKFGLRQLWEFSPKNYGGSKKKLLYFRFIQTHKTTVACNCILNNLNIYLDPLSSSKKSFSKENESRKQIEAMLSCKHAINLKWSSNYQLSIKDAFCKMEFYLWDSLYCLQCHSIKLTGIKWKVFNNSFVKSLEFL